MLRIAPLVLALTAIECSNILAQQIVPTEQDKIDICHITLPALTTSPWQNDFHPMDANDDHFVSPADALLIIMELRESRPVFETTADLVPPYFGRYPDVDGDFEITQNDVRLVVDHLNTIRSGTCPASPVPEPSTSALMIPAVLLIHLLRRPTGAGC